MLTKNNVKPYKYALKVTSAGLSNHRKHSNFTQVCKFHVSYTCHFFINSSFNFSNSVIILSIFSNGFVE